MAEKILVIDDDPKLNSLLEEYLTGFSFEVTTATLPSAGIKLLRQWQPDILIVDLMMPEQNGLDVCKEVRGWSHIPIIMLTAKGDTTDKIIGLEIGADDYLAKPFEPRELVARIRSQLRRSVQGYSNQGEILAFADVELNKVKEDVHVAGQFVALTHKEFTLLWLLASKAPAIVSRDQIMNHLSGVDADAYDRSIDVMVSRIRHKLGDNARHPRYIGNVRNAGYRIIQ